MEPLASRFRPKTLDEFVGQQHLVGTGKPIRTFIESGKIPSMIFWGPPGTGKTTLAYIISKTLKFNFYGMSAVTSGKKKLLEVVAKAKEQVLFNKGSVLFIDEIHRWNKAQQDSLLQYVEKGTIILIGATTENPSFSVNSALLSRVKVFVFSQIDSEDIRSRLLKVIGEIKDELNFSIAEDEIKLIASMANGDLRSALNILEMAINLLGDKERKILKTTIENAIQKQIYYDKDGEEHYNLISAVHKSLRSSNADAAVYWIMRMFEAGEDPRYMARRMIRFASEDIGNADPQALVLANAVYNTVEKIGAPECDTALIQLAQYLANAPKNNSCYIAAQKARLDVKEHGNLPVPLHLRNAETDLMKEIGYGKGYEYDHDLKSKKSKQQCMPDKLKDRTYF